MLDVNYPENIIENPDEILEFFEKMDRKAILVQHVFLDPYRDFNEYMAKKNA